MAFLGQDGFVWAIGVVEDRFDPEKQGRVRVRWLGYHTDEKARILTKDLPWAQVMQPVSNNSMSGVGDAPVNLVEGSWVVGFFRDPGTLQDPIVIGTMPGQNTTTALTAESGKKWAEYRGVYKKYNQDQSYGDDNKVVEGSENDYKDYERGFFDPTVDQRKIPAPPSEMSWMNSLAGTAVTLPSPYVLFDYEDPKLFPRIMNWSPEDMDLWDLDCDDAIIPKEFETDGPKSYARINHSDVLHDMFKTTRRVTSDIRWCTAWTDFGKFQWPDTMTYSKDYSEKPTNFVLGKGTKWEVAERKKGEDRDAVTFSTGYLETDYWRDPDRSMPAWPWIRQMAAVSKDPTSLTGISPTDTRAGWGQSSGDETGYWALSGESYRTTYPRVRYLQKGHLSPSQKDEIKKLFEHGHYGTGTYQLDAKEGERREDIKWTDVKGSDLVVVPTPDTNRLALGGIPIASFDGASLTTQSGFFTTADTSMGANARPLNLQSGDVVQIAGCRGFEDCNGHVFRAESVGWSGGVFTVALASMGGKTWSGPGPIGWKWPEETWSISAGAVVAPDTAADYVANTGVLIIDPHPVLQWKSDARERQINVGSPNAESGLSKVFWNQPTSSFAAQYPFNNVYESESGHIKEYDDTPGAERIHEYHRSGTYNEVNADGSKVDYVKGDNYDIRIHDDYMYVKGKVMHTFDDEVYIRYNDRADISAKYKLQIWSGGDLDIHSKRNINMKSDGDINFQADGHINFLGTTITEAQAEEKKAGTRLCKEYSKIKMKAGHFQMEMVGDPLYTEEPAISLQSNQGHIQIKTLEELKSIFITSAEDIELYANRNQYRTAWEGNMWDYAHIDHNIMASTGNIHILAAGTEHDATESGKGSIFITGKRWVDIEACKEDLNLTTGWKDINLYANNVSDPVVAGGNINLYCKWKDGAVPSGVFSLIAEDQIMMQALGTTIKLETADDDIYIKSGKGIYEYASDGPFHMKASTTVNIEATTVMNLLAGGNILETGAEIHLNGPTAASATDAVSPVPGVADKATPALLSTPAYIAESFELMVTDLPNPMFADPLRLPEDSHGIALTPNITGGFGGENIRDLQDLLSEMSSGMVGRIPVYPTENEGSAVGDMWIGNRTTEGEAGDYTTGVGITDPWDGYKDQVEELEPLGKRLFSEERRFLGWTTSGDTPVVWNCISDSTK